MIFTESVRSATSLASQGDFQSAIEFLGNRWPGIGVEPARNGESDLDYAQLLLVCGILTVKGGKFTAQSQAEAKDILSKSARLFGDDSGKYEALFWLATAYSFCGEHKEALSLVEAIVSDQRADINTEFSAGILKGYTEMSLGLVDLAAESFSRIEIFLPAVAPITRGKFYLTRGVFFRQTGRFEEALADYAMASEFFVQAGSLRYEAAAKNNAAGVLTEQGRFEEARGAATEALSVFARLGDQAHEAKAWDQLARIYEREENYPEMVRHADRAVEILSAGDHEGWLAEALITQGVARARLGTSEAMTALRRALEICERQGDAKQADDVTRAMWEIVRRGDEARDSLREGYSQIERAVYERLLEKHGERISPAAHEIGYTHQALQRRLKYRFPELLTKRLPPRRRHKTVIKIR